jgi:hypothetical protein
VISQAATVVATGAAKCFAKRSQRLEAARAIGYACAIARENQLHIVALVVVIRAFRLRFFELAHGFVVFALDAGLVTEEEAHARHLGRIGEEDCERGIGVEIGVLFLDRVDAVVEEGGLNAGEALEAPSGRDDSVGQQGFGFTDGRELFAEVRFERVVLLLIFASDDGLLAGEAVGEAVESGSRRIGRVPWTGSSSRGWLRVWRARRRRTLRVCSLEMEKGSPD